MLSGRPVYCVERCLLATGVADAAFTSKQQGTTVSTPWLTEDIAYTVAADQDERMWRPLGPRPTVLATLSHHSVLYQLILPNRYVGTCRQRALSHGNQLRGYLAPETRFGRLLLSGNNDQNCDTRY